MKKEYRKGTIKDSRFPISLFVIYYGVLFLMAGIHTGLIVLGNRQNWSDLVQTIIPIVYWGLVAAALTLFTRHKMKRTYEKPMHMLAAAATKVANGDFSVYVPALHTANKLDYLDVMIMDFNKMVEELGSIETLKTDFVSNVSHEMKTPIAIIKNYAELLQMKSITQEQRKEYGAGIESAAIRLSGLISNILKLNKLENQSLILEAEVYDVCRQLCECILQFEDVWEEKEIDLKIEIEDEAKIKADASLLDLVWNNLISNAVKFTQPGGSITICLVLEQGDVRVTIADTGCGMSRECMNHIFDKFYQGDISHSTEGNGLGLALVKRVLELMEGDIQVSSQVGKGSAFTITLPAVNNNKEHGGK